MIWKTITRFNMFWTLLLEPDGVDINWFLHTRNKIGLKTYIINISKANIQRRFLPQLKFQYIFFKLCNSLKRRTFTLSSNAWYVNSFYWQSDQQRKPLVYKTLDKIIVKVFLEIVRLSFFLFVTVPFSHYIYVYI